MRIAILEDDTHVGQLISLWLEAEGHDCRLFATWAELRKLLGRESFDLLILDWTLPDTTGDTVLDWVRNHLDWHMPVIVVTVHNSEDDIVKGLVSGADDYMGKPVRQKELLARITAVTRRINKPAEQSGVMEFPPFRIDPASHGVTVNGQAVELTNKEFELVLFLFRNVGRMLSRGHILESVWGHDSNLNTRTVDTHVSRVRAKLNIVPESGWRLSAVYHFGYRLERLE